MKKTNKQNNINRKVQTFTHTHWACIYSCWRACVCVCADLINDFYFHFYSFLDFIYEREMDDEGIRHTHNINL